MNIRTPHPELIISGLLKAGKPFTVQQTTFTKKIVTEFGTFNFVNNKESSLTGSELAFVKLVRDCKKKKPAPFFSHEQKKRIQYIAHDERHFRNNLFVQGATEIDLSGAYWNASKDFLHDDVFRKGLTVSKRARLVALGALAKTVSKYRAEAGKLIYEGTSESKETEGYFFQATEKVSHAMQYAKRVAGNSFLFFWVDAIFVDDITAAEKVKDFFTDTELLFKDAVCDSVFFDNGKIVVRGGCKDGTRIFNCKKQFDLINSKRIILQNNQKQKAS